MDIKRVAAVTGGLMLAGAVAGGVAGAVVITIFTVTGGGELAADGPSLTDPNVVSARVLLLGAALGALTGAVLGPLAAWMLMRHVPLGLAIGGTALGTLAGAVAGLFTSDPFRGLRFSLIGFVVSALALRIFTPRRVSVPRGPSA